MSRRIGEFLRSNVLGLIAIFIALSGTAIAGSVPNDSVVSESIVDGEVMTTDIALDAVGSGRIADETVQAWMSRTRI
jgi:hypothetical protein